MNTYAIHYCYGLGTAIEYFWAISPQDVVDLFRKHHSERIVAVYRLEKVGDWQ